MNLLRILLLLFGTTNIAYSNDLEIVRRRVQSSMNYGSANQNNYQSGIESKQTTTSYKGSMKYGSQVHGSTAKQSHNVAQRGSMNYGSTTKQSHNVVQRSSMKYGSHNNNGHSSQIHGSQVYGSTAMKKQSHNSIQHGSMNYGSQKHGSYAIKRHGSQRHGSTALHKVSQKHNSGSNGGSNTKYMSAYVFSAMNYGSNNNYCTKSKGSGTRGGSGASRGSGANKYSAPSSSQIYDIFAPTHRPTEQEPPIYSPPRPTNQPTFTMTIPEIPGLSTILNPPTDITVPTIGLSFQIKQGGNGWSTYPDPPSTLTNAVSAVTGLNKKYITNMRVSTQNSRRILTAQFYFYYNITVPIQDFNTDKNKLYTAIIYLLQYSVINGAFTDYFKNMSMPINITSIVVSPYTIVYPSQLRQIESTNNKSDPTLFYFYIVFGTLISVAGVSNIAYFVYKKRNMKNNTIKFRDSIPNPMQKQIQLVAN